MRKGEKNERAEKTVKLTTLYKGKIKDALGRGKGKGNPTKEVREGAHQQDP